MPTSSFFDPEDLVSPPSSFFDKEDLVATPAVQTKSSFFDPEDIAKEDEPVTGEENHGWMGKAIDDQDLQRIADKHGVPVDMLKDRASLYGGNYSPDSADLGTELVEGGKTLAGKIANATPFALHKIIDKKLHDNPNERAALDDLNELVYNKSGKLDVAADIGTQALLTGGAGKLASAIGEGASAFSSVLKAIDSTAGIIGQGAAAGLNESREGHELMGAGLGAALATGLLGLGHIAGKAFGKPAAKEGEQAAVKQAENLLEGETDNALRIAKQVQADPATAAQKAAVTNPEKLDSLSAFRQAEEFAPLRKSASGEANQSLAETTEEVAQKLEKGEIDSTKGNLVDSIQADQAIMEKLASKGISPDQVSAEVVQHAKDWNAAREDLIKFAQDKINPEIKTYEQASTAIKDISKQEGPAAVAQYYETFKVGRALKKELAYKFEAYSPDFISKVFDHFADTVLVYRQMDKMYGGLGAQDLQTELSRHTNGYINKKAFLLKDANAKFRNMEKAVGEGFDLRSFLNEKPLEQIQKDIELLPPTHKQAVQDFVDFMRKGLAEANKDDAGAGVKGLTIGELNEGKTGYVPNIVTDNKNVILIMEKKVSDLNKEIGADITRMSPEHLAQTLESLEETSPLAKDVKDGLRFLSRTEEPDGETLRQTLLSYNKIEKTRSATEFNIAAAHERKGGIPEFLLERDPVKLINKWHNNTFKAKYHKQDVYKMKQLAGTLRAIGDESNASYVENHIKDMAGVRHDTFAASFQNRKLAWDLNYQRKFNSASTATEKNYYKMMQLLPQTLSVMQAGMYPFYLGMKVANVVRNVTQPIFTTALEGATLAHPLYGMSKVLPAIGEAYKLLVDPKAFKAVVEEMRAKGLMPAEFDPLHIKWAKEGTDSELAKTNLAWLLKAKDAGAWLDNRAMFAYGMSDTLNRIVTYKAAESMAADMAKGHPKAMATLKALSGGTEARVLDHLNQGNLRAAQDLLAKDLIATTQFNYDRASLNEFGRTYGTFFSAFTKWPANVAGDIMYTAKQAKGVYGKDAASMSAAKQKLMLKYFAPLGIMMLGDVAANVSGAKDDPWFQLMLGHGSLTGFAPAASLFPIVEGRGLSVMPAAVQNLGKTAVKATQGQANIHDWLNVFMQGVPGGTMYQFLDKGIKDWEGVTGMDLQPEVFKRDE